VQSLTSASKSRRAAKPAAKASAGRRSAACAEAIMGGIPPIMWFWRQQMGANRAKGLSVAQFRVLCVVEREAANSLTEVATLTGSSLPAASRLVGRLVERGYLTRDESDDDRRCRRLVLSDRGREVLLAGRAAVRDALAAELRAGLSDAQCERVAEAMRLLDDVFTAARVRGTSSA
ncbi:MarR family transcriptional regulator, partial [bacterium]